MIINQPKSDFPLKTKANKRPLPATILGYSQIKFIFSRHVHVYVKPNQDHLWRTKCGSVQELAAPAPRQGLCPLCATSSAWLGGKPPLWMTNCSFHHRLPRGGMSWPLVPWPTCLALHCSLRKVGKGLGCWHGWKSSGLSALPVAMLPCCGAFLHHLLSVKLFLTPCCMES